MIFEKIFLMKHYILVMSILFTNVIVSQEQQLGNVSSENNANQPAQFAQTNMNSNIGNLNNDNNQRNQIIKQLNLIDNIGNYIQTTQNNNSVKGGNKSITSNGNTFNFSFNISSRVISSSGSSSSSKYHKRTFSKKLSKFQRNFYGKMTSHKKSKHLVDVCFNWSK